MANTYKKIQTVTIGAGGASSIEFTNIPQTYTDLKILLSIRSARVDTDDTYYLDFNSYAGTNLSSRRLVGNGSTVASATNSSQISWTVNAANNTASVFGNSEIYIPNYTSSNNKVVSIDTVTENNGTTAFAILVSGLWASSSAITSLKIYSANAQNTAQYSTATLYGIFNEVKATGGAITADANFIYHTFTSDGTFTPRESLTVDYLVVAGGGGGGTGQYTMGGGGAGGARCTVGATGGGGSLESALSLTAQAYTVTVGGGGNANTNGNNSVFGSITSTGGGKGASTSGTVAGSGGSGGGGSETVANRGTGGAASPSGQGYKGGDYTNNAHTVQAGGGGAGAVGGNSGTTTASGNGGNGITTSISGTSTTYAGGGGAGAWGAGNSLIIPGGTGGGANGRGSNSTSETGFAGTANTGGGGGGSTGLSGVGGAGGSGIVIVRYAR